MFEDVWHSSGVRWVCLEADAEDIVGIVSCDVQILCARLVVGELECRQF